MNDPRAWVSFSRGYDAGAEVEYFLSNPGTVFPSGWINTYRNCTVDELRCIAQKAEHDRNGWRVCRVSLELANRGHALFDDDISTKGVDS